MEAENELAEKVQRLLDPIADNLGLIVESVIFNERQVPASLRITVDRREGTESATLDEIAEISRQISSKLDQVDPIPSGYVLEVSTPGAGSNLTKPRHYFRNIGRRVQVRVRNGETLEGILKEADDHSFVLQLPTERRKLEYDEVRRVRPRMDFGEERR